MTSIKEAIQIQAFEEHEIDLWWSKKNKTLTICDCHIPAIIIHGVKDQPVFHDEDQVDAETAEIVKQITTRPKKPASSKTKRRRN